MGKFLDDLKASGHAPIATQQRFRLEYKAESADVYAFFESTDDATFYRNQIARHMRPEGRLRIYFCGSKSSVWHLYQFAEQGDKLANTVFFVDKDLDDFIGQSLPIRSRVFVTNYYSIENYLCTEEAVAAVLEEIIFLPNEGNSYEKILWEFRLGFEDFSIQLRPLFSEVILLRQRSSIVSFSDLGDGLSHCFEMVNLRAKPVHEWDQIFRNRCRYSISNLGSDDLLATEALLAKKHNHTWLRGKFAVWFFIQFMNDLWRTLAGMLINDRKKIKKTMNLSMETIFLTMQGRHPEPIGLLDFLRLNIV